MFNITHQLFFALEVSVTEQHINCWRYNKPLCSTPSWHNTTQHNTTHHKTTQHYTTQHITKQHNTTHHNTTQHNTTQHNTSQHNTTQHKHTVHTTHCLKFTSHKHTNAEPHTVPSTQYMYETTLLELLNCAILCSLTTVTGRFILHELQMVKLQEEKPIYRK